MLEKRVLNFVTGQIKGLDSMQRCQTFRIHELKPDMNAALA